MGEFFWGLATVVVFIIIAHFSGLTPAILAGVIVFLVGALKTADRPAAKR